MRILFISDNAILHFHGGNAENQKYYYGIKRYCEKYGHNLKVITRDTDIDDLLGAKVEKTKKTDILSRVYGHTSFLYITWKENIKLIKEYNPDLIFIGRSRLGFIAKDAKKEFPNARVITVIDNVEFDFVESYFSKRKGFKAVLYKSIEKILVKRDEGNTIKYSDKLVYLTSRNVERINCLYGLTEKEPVIVPICLKNEIDLTIHSEKRHVFFIGSLDYEANILAVEELLKIWKSQFLDNQSLQLIIAGRNPSNGLKNDIKEISNATIIPDFESIGSIIPQYSLMIAPIEKGAGMKTKVAEALSMGVLIAASDEALVGYELACDVSEGKGIIRCNCKEEYVQAINYYTTLNESDLEEISNTNKELFNKLYSYLCSYEKIKNILDELHM